MADSIGAWTLANLESFPPYVGEMEGEYFLRGRIIQFRRQGGIAFGQLSDSSGICQFAFKKSDFASPELFVEACAKGKIGSIIKLVGKVGKTSTGMWTLFATEIEVYRESLRGFPDKWNGVSEETSRRHRFLECITNIDAREIVHERNRLLKSLRNVMEAKKFVEVETPVLAQHASGAIARPFKTHSNAHDKDMYLRIAPETYLKRMVAGGFDRVFEIGKNFRNEGEDSSHLPEFSVVEWYSAYYNYMDNLKLFQQFLREYAFKSKAAEESGIYKESPEIISYKDLLFDSSLSHSEFLTMSAHDMDTYFKKEIRPKIIEPTYVIDYPAKLSPMAKRTESDESIVEQWQFIMNGHEIAKCYTELTDPVLQRKLLEEQAIQKNGGAEAMDLEEDFLATMEWGMPPMSGLGMGIDRLLQIVLKKNSLKDVVFFPPVF